MNIEVKQKHDLVYINATAKDETNTIVYCNHVNTHFEDQIVELDESEVVEVCDLCGEIV